jgi:membrane protein implicated in regulation of membrane protease activity
VLAFSIPAGVVTLYFYGANYATALFYGVIAGLISFVSTAFTTSLIIGKTSAIGMAIGGASFAGRLGFAAVALGVPAYLNLWPVVIMLMAFVAVYVAENVLLVPVLLGKGNPSSQAVQPVDNRMERRTKV